MKPLEMNACPTHTGTFHSPKGMLFSSETSEHPNDVDSAVTNSRPPQSNARRYPQRSNAGIGSGAVAISYPQRPNGWRVSGEPGRAQRATRVRCTRGLGGATSCLSEWPVTIVHV